MTALWWIFKREVKSYFVSPVAYFVLFIFALLSGVFFYLGFLQFSKYSLQVVQMRTEINFNATELVMRNLFQVMSTLILFISPILTMRLFSEEKKQCTVELLLTYPIREYQLVLGKFFAAMLIIVVMMGITYTYPGIIAYCSSNVNWGEGLFSGLGDTIPSFLWLSSPSDPEPGVVFTGYLGLILLAACFIALGMFCSSLTENQIISAVMTFGLILFFWIIGFGKFISQGTFMGDFMEHLSLMVHYENFAKGVIATKDLAYYLSFTIFFVFITIRSIESNRWRG